MIIKKETIFGGYTYAATDERVDRVIGFSHANFARVNHGIEALDR